MCWMTDLEKYLQQVKSRCDTATEGPWFGFEDQGVDNVKEGSSVFKIFETGCNCCTSNKLSEPNATFIAQARTDVPKLLDMVEYLKESLDYFNDSYTEDLEKIARGEG